MRNEIIKRPITPLKEFEIALNKRFYERDIRLVYFNNDTENLINFDYQDYVLKKIPKYNLTKGINEKKYRSIAEQVIVNIPKLKDWLDPEYIKKNDLLQCQVVKKVLVFLVFSKKDSKYTP